VADPRRQSLLLPDSLKLFTKHYLLDYLGQQVDFNNNFRQDIQGLKKGIRDVGEIYLSQLVAYGKLSESHYRDAQQLIPFYNKLSGMFYRNLYSYNERIPFLIMGVLIIGSWLIGMLVGFMNGFYTPRHYLVPLIFVILVLLSIQAIFDLNNPTSGSIKVNYEDFKYQKDILEQGTR
jgi:hypothetical protein